MKIYPIIISERFLKTHPRAGEETGFIKKLLNQVKIHTVRVNFDFWEKRVKNINAGEGYLSIRIWSGKPYRSTQEEYMRITKCGIQLFDIVEKRIYVDKKAFILNDAIKLAHNDGFEDNVGGLKNFMHWMGADKKDIRNACIIHLTDFSYE